MEDLLAELFGSWGGVVLSLMGVCAAVAALLPAPAQGDSMAYKMVYRVLNLLAVNVGRAKNADEAAEEKKV